MDSIQQRDFGKYAEVIIVQLTQSNYIPMTPDKKPASTDAEQLRINDLHTGRAKWRDFGPF